MPLEFKNKGYLDYLNYAKIIMGTNNIPSTGDKTIGFFRKWLIIDFPNSFPEDVDILATIPEIEYENLGPKCIGLLINLIKNRKFHNEGTIEDRMKKYEDRADFLQKFLDEFVVDETDGYISKSDFYKRFKDWCIENKFRLLGENTLGRMMKEKEIASSRKRAEWLHDGRGGQMRIWAGIRWKEQE